MDFRRRYSGTPRLKPGVLSHVKLRPSAITPAKFEDRRHSNANGAHVQGCRQDRTAALSGPTLKALGSAGDTYRSVPM